MKKMHIVPLLLGLTISLSMNSLAANPLYPNSIVSTSFDFIKDSDPNVLETLQYVEYAQREMPDKRGGGLMRNAYVFKASFSDNTRVEIWANQDFGSKQEAEKYVKLLADALGQQPTFLRKSLNHVVLHNGNETASAEESGGFFMIYSQNMNTRISNHDLQETVFHESSHVAMEKDHAKASGWVKAQNADKGFITDYAQQIPDKEDIPESAIFAFTILNHPGRLSSSVERAVKDQIKNRIEYFKNNIDGFVVGGDNNDDDGGDDDNNNTAIASTMTSPANGSTLSGSSVTFKWKATTGDYHLYIGTVVGGNQLFSQSASGTQKTVSNLPTNGSDVYVRLWTKINGSWKFNDYHYKAKSNGGDNDDNNTSTTSTMTSPANGSTLSGSSVTFKWKATTGEYHLYIGTAVGGNQLFSQSASGTQKTVSNLPTNGSKVYVRLWTKVNGSWKFNDYLYKAKSNEGGGDNNNATKNYVNNGGFESGMSGWVSWINSSAGYDQTANPYKGSRNLAHWSGSSYEVATRQDISGVPNGTYKAAVWAKSTGGQSVCDFYVYGFNGNNDVKSVAISATSRYKQIVINNINVVNGKCTVAMYSKSPAGKWATFDNVILIRQ